MASAPFLGKSGTAKLDDAVFAQRFNEGLVHECVRAELNARRQGTASTKTRGNVRGGGAKPWRQKGTGRARAGSSRSPIWTGGGVTFGPAPRHYTFKVNRKARRAGLRSALSLHAQRGSLAILPAGAFDAPATKHAAAALSGWGQPSPALIVLGPEEGDAQKSFRNLPAARVLTGTGAGIADILRAAALVISEDALPELVARATGERTEADGAGTAEEAAA